VGGKKKLRNQHINFYVFEIDEPEHALSLKHYHKQATGDAAYQH